MKPTRLQWEDVIQFEEVKGYGQHVWRDGNHLYYVDEEGGNVEDILRGRQKYRIEPPTFVPDVFPTDINQVLFEYFYNQNDIKNIQLLLENSLIKLTKSSATDLYISILFFDSILHMEDKGIATFKIDTSRLVAEIASGIQKFREELKKSITFDNGLIKKDPMNVIVRFNQRYNNKYNFSILED